jgi:dolichyl-phosphate beta-glucosyltransferase
MPARAEMRRFLVVSICILFACIESEVQAVTYVVAPCYNEELRLPRDAYREFFKDPVNKDIHLTFVNDGSKDNTLRLITDIAQEFPSSITVLDLVVNRGKAEAVRQGMVHVIRDQNLTHDDVIGFWDSDLATPLETIPRFVALFDKRPRLEMVFGARVALLGREIHRQPDRHYLGRIFATLASFVLNLAIYDTQCGAKLFRATPDFRAALAAPFSTGWIFDVELLARLISRRRAADGGAGTGTARPPIEQVVYEYPLEKWTDIAGSKLRFSAKVGALYGLLAIWAEHFGPGLQATLAAAAATALAVLAAAAFLFLRLRAAPPRNRQDRAARS